MTKYETDQIFKSRLQNEDYKTIAKRMSIKAKTIASYCYRNGLTDSNIDSISECCYCHEKIEQKAKGKKRLFCNDKCRSAWRRAHHMLIEPVYHHVCAGCGTAFKTAGNKSQKYCSRQCYLNHRKGMPLRSTIIKNSYNFMQGGSLPEYMLTKVSPEPVPKIVSGSTR